MHVIARRGVTTKNVPSNTLDAVILSQNVPSIDGITLDVRLTKDGALVVFEREEIAALLNGKGNISAYTLAELKTFNMGTEIHHQAISTLTEALSEISLNHLILLHIGDAFDRNELLVDQLLKALIPFSNLNIWLASEQLEVLLLLQARQVIYPLGQILNSFLDFSYLLDVSFFVLSLSVIDPVFISKQRKDKKDIFLYPVNSKKTLLMLQNKLGPLLDEVYLITDRVQLLVPSTIK